ncbi:hypothetical protein DERP_005618 [Dermatophagoides pteronyssinus]|uniref:Uncharacterized protein n=1 Tax=Dermatophagoides pteronyssinus TaxID=6956 RepID=A0ABQ8J928_DERPT|nr:hypothetical protein DERP_005618 [Dermatophagoides pteronyssinus]
MCHFFLVAKQKLISRIILSSRKKNGAEIFIFFAPNQHRNVDDLTYFNIAINSLYSNDIDQDISII